MENKYIELGENFFSLFTIKDGRKIFKMDFKMFLKLWTEVINKFYFEKLENIIAIQIIDDQHIDSLYNEDIWNKFQLLEYFISPADIRELPNFLDIYFNIELKDYLWLKIWFKNGEVLNIVRDHYSIDDSEKTIHQLKKKYSGCYATSLTDTSEWREDEGMFGENYYIENNKIIYYKKEREDL